MVRSRAWPVCSATVKVMPKIQTVLRLLIPAIVAAASAPPVSAAGSNCSVSAGTFPFGSYDRTSSAPLDVTGTINVLCSPSGAHTVKLSRGGSASYARRMANAANLLNYNLYTDRARATILGDGTGGTAFISGNTNIASYLIFGRIPALQNVPNGNYLDTIVMTITY
jgi:spore coat protein U-like protein